MEYNEPIQAFELSENEESLPEKTLLLAVIDRALRDLQKTASTGQELRELHETKQWFLSDSEEAWSFIWCAEHIGDSLHLIIREGIDKYGIEEMVRKLGHIDLGRRRVDYVYFKGENCENLNDTNETRSGQRREEHSSSGTSRQDPKETNKAKRKDPWTSWDNLFGY